MKKKLASKSIWQALLVALIVPILVWAYAEGPPDAHTGGFNEPNCTECHIGKVNSFSGRVTISVNANGSPVTSYSSGTTYSVTVTDFDTAQRRWGFELSSRTQGGTQAGTLNPGSDGFTQIAAALANPKIQYIEHTLAGTRNGARDTGSGVSFSFSWTAPDVSAGPVVFNAAGNAANGNGDNTEDHIYTTSLTLQPQAPPAGPPPSVPDGGVLNNASFNHGSNAIAPGTIVAIFGQDMTDGTSCAFPSCGPTFDANGVVLTTMSGTQVLVNGAPSSMFNTTPGQLVVVLPSNVSGPTASLQVTVAGQSSTPVTFPVSPLAPGIFTLNNQGTGQGAILVDGTALIAGPAGAGARPAHPGEFIDIFCTGLGAVNNPPGDGKIAPNGTSTTTTPVLASIGGIPATVQFAGLAPGFVGLYQVNVQVPVGAPKGDALTLSLSIGGVQSNPVTIAVGP